MTNLADLARFSFDVHDPGRILQLKEHNIANWVISHAIFMTSRDRTMRAHRYPLDKDRYTEPVYSG